MASLFCPAVHREAGSVVGEWQSPGVCSWEWEDLYSALEGLPRPAGAEGDVDLRGVDINHPAGGLALLLGLRASLFLPGIQCQEEKGQLMICWMNNSQG